MGASTHKETPREADDRHEESNELETTRHAESMANQESLGIRIGTVETGLESVRNVLLSQMNNITEIKGNVRSAREGVRDLQSRIKDFNGQTENMKELGPLIPDLKKVIPLVPDIVEMSKAYNDHLAVMAMWKRLLLTLCTICGLGSGVYWAVQIIQSIYH